MLRNSARNLASVKSAVISVFTLSESCFLSMPALLFAATVKLAVPAVVGDPAITPAPSSDKPAGKVSESRYQLAAVPVASSV